MCFRIRAITTLQSSQRAAKYKKTFLQLNTLTYFLWVLKSLQHIFTWASYHRIIHSFLCEIPKTITLMCIRKLLSLHLSIKRKQLFCICSMAKWLAKLMPGHDKLWHHYLCRLILTIRILR